VTVPFGFQRFNSIDNLQERHMNTNPEVLRQQRDELYQDARSHPDSEADQMVQILLLSALRNQQANYDADLGDALERERHGYHEVRARRIDERRRAETNRPASGTGGAEAGGGQAGSGDAGETGESGMEPADVEMRLMKVAQALESAQAAAESGKEMDPMKVYNKIAQIVGLQPHPGDPTYAAMFNDRSGV
jgi:hypothetical protein